MEWCQVRSRTSFAGFGAGIAYDGINGGHQVGASPDVAHDFMKAVYAAKEECFVYVYISNENANLIDVYFDDVVMTHKRSRLIQGNEYYPFGMQTANSWTREAVTGNNYLANGGTEMNATTQLYDLEFRNYDPALGRMFQVDPVAAKYASLTPYNYSFNNPIAFADPSGADPDPEYQNPNHQYYFHNGAGAAGYPGLTYDDVVPQSARGEFNSAFGWRQDVMLGWFAGGGNMGAYWHPGDGRLFWSGYESAAREYRLDQDRVRYGDLSQENFDRKYNRPEGGSRNAPSYNPVTRRLMFTPPKHRLSVEGEKFVKSHESFRGKVYDDNGKKKGGNMTIGWGHKLTPKEKSENVFKDGITLEKGNEIFESDRREVERVVNQKLANRGLSVTQNQFDALFSLYYNAGNQADAILRMMNSGQTDRIFSSIENFAITENGHILRRLGEALMFSENYYAPAPSLLLPVTIKGN